MARPRAHSPSVDTASFDTNPTLLARLFADLPDGSLITDTDHRITHVNAGFTRMTGYEQPEVAGWNCNFLQGAGTDQGTVEAIRTSLAAGIPYRGPILNYRKDGSPFWNFLTIAPLRDRSGQVTHFVSVQLDVTDFISGHDLTRQLLANERELRQTADLLLDAARALNRTSSVAEATAAIADLGRTLTGSDRATVATWNDREQSLSVAASSGMQVNLDPRAPSRQPDASRLDDLERILASPEPAVLHRADSPTLRALLPNSATTAALAAPISLDGSVLGLILTGWDDNPVPPGSTASVRLRSLADLAGAALASAQLLDATSWNAVHDPLTGLLNRSVIIDTVAHALERGRIENTSTAVLYCDIDQFKLINDNLGHSAGDTVLVAVAAALQSAVRLGDVVARMGGDEFTIVLSAVAGMTEAVQVVERIRNQLALPVCVDSTSVTIGLSIGIAIDQPRESTAPVGLAAAALIRTADARMYLDKVARSAVRATDR